MHTRNPDTPSAPAADPSATTGDDPGPTVVLAPLPAGDRYRLGEEIARGGMGAVFRATDAALGRDVAVKVLLDKYAPDSGTARRFNDEAKVTGQLQHPGIPPVHDLGLLPDGRPFLAMKLIKGETLDDLLAARRSLADDRGRWLGVFEKVCEAVAYAHAHDVIHRDLKPQNVMVGAFGEVQVMDWGLAKVLTPFSRPTESGADDPDATSAGTAIRTERDSEDLLTQAGAVLGTPAYMPPEQAIGAIDQIDRRSDVFGLGGILAAILTGRPPFVGDTAESTRQMAATRKLGDCFERLDGSGAEPDLIALCKRCLTGEKDDRPADAEEVAAAVAALRVAAEERARRAVVDAAEGRVREAEGRKRRRAWYVVVGVLLAGVIGASVLAVWATTEADRAGRQERATAAALDEAVRERDAKVQALAAVTAERNAKSASLGRVMGWKIMLFDALVVVSDRVRQQLPSDKSAITEQDREYVSMIHNLWEVIATDGDIDPDYHPPRTNYARGQLYEAVGDGPRALEAYRRSAAGLDGLCRSHPDIMSYSQWAMAASVALAAQLDRAGRREEGTAAYRAGLARLGALRATRGVVYQLELHKSHYQGAREILDRIDRTQRMDVYLEYHTELCAWLEDILRMSRDDGYAIKLLAFEWRWQGQNYAHAGRWPQAEAAYKRALGVQLGLLSRAEATPDDRRTAVELQTDLAGVYDGSGRSREAADAYRVAVDRADRLVTDHPDDAACVLAWASVWSGYGLHLKAHGSPAGCVPALTTAIDALARAEAALAADQQTDLKLTLLKLAQCYAARADAYQKLGERASATADYDRLAGMKSPHEPEGVGIWRADALARAGQADRAAAVVTDLVRSSAGRSGDDWYNLACVLALASGQSSGRRDEYAGRAMDLLRKAVATGYKNAAHMWTDADLDPLRPRSDFQRLLAALGAAREPAPPPRSPPTAP